LASAIGTHRSRFFTRTICCAHGRTRSRDDDTRPLSRTAVGRRRSAGRSADSMRSGAAGAAMQRLLGIALIVAGAVLLLVGLLAPSADSTPGGASVWLLVGGAAALLIGLIVSLFESGGARRR